MIKYHTARLEELIEQYMETRSWTCSPVSVAAAAAIILAEMPDCAIQAQELSSMIARSAVRHGHAVSFDL
ncbi:hypothetical protein FJW04_18140 [Mesorhizobium sp. B2-7-3]|uniref:hypothetical protein n=1 Tax=Mesorhizobium sp. B2-7-3 TaxID=2589907 RepID=UPI00112D3372|nr:hypothetical protein [Mesorhizobium sp. B2-7-3]TPJ14405.1 hypothetical protein FJW04_18140 [Mesorhizobium sp. B2-7-3]